MGADSFKELKRHVGHKIVCVTYGTPAEKHKGKIIFPKIWNVAIECEDCNEVLMDYDNEGG